MSAATANDLRWLDAAVRFATPYRGTTADNSAAAALVVDPVAGILLGRAVTAPDGRPHAEPQALEAAGDAARGKTLYVTLEPCNHWGRTPPCVDVVIRAGIARVVIGMADPDPRTAGASIKRLIDAGIDVVIADHEPSRRLHEGHVRRHALGRPYVTLQLAVSTSEDGGRWTDMVRAQSDAIMIGAAAAEATDPALAIRLPGLERRTPVRIVMVGARGVDTKLNLIAGFTGHRLVIMTTSDATLRVPPSVEIIRIFGQRGRPDLREALSALSAKGIARLLVEGGATLREAFLDADLVDRFELLSGIPGAGQGGIAATIQGGIEHRLAAAGFIPVDQRPVGNDTLRTFEKPMPAPQKAI